MAEITSEMVKELRELTGAGMMDCKRALTETGGDFAKAVEVLRTKGLASAAKKAARAANQGIVGSYIHGGGRVGVLIEVNCETDFVARTEEFQALVHDLAMQVAAANPVWVTREEAPAELVENERRILKAQAETESGGKKPPQVVDKIVEGRVDKFLKERCLLEQPFIKDPDQTVKDVVTAKVAKIGENISVKRFARFAVGEAAPAGC
ncbi:MAG: translation elongation factor Ts [Bacillota bacterium]